MTSPQFVHRLLHPNVKADEPKNQLANGDGDDEQDIIDPQDELREKCAATRELTRLFDTLQECNQRVNSRTKTTETCEQELFDYVHALDHCVAKTLFQRLV